MTTKKTSTAPTVESIRHQDKRVNIPTEELRDFVQEDEASPKQVLYPRDPSLDPQLVWKGKDEQDQQPLAVDNVPIYIQEKIHPQALIEDLRRHQPSTSGRGQGEGSADQLNFFADFNGAKDFGELVDFYHHEQHWANRLILGDSLLVMTSLAEKEGLKGKVQMIYVDPPYGIDFRSNWQVSTRKTNVRDGKIEDLTRQPEQIKAFRDTWELGIHSYLTYLRDRLVAARDLLTESGSIFVQIGDQNVHLVRCLLDEVFGSENSCALIPFRKKTMPMGTVLLEQMDDFLLWYARNREVVKYRQLFQRKAHEGDANWRWYETSNGERRPMAREQVQNHSLLPRGVRMFRLKSLEPSGPMESGFHTLRFEGRVYHHPTNGWATGPDGMSRLAAAHRLFPNGTYLQYLFFHHDYPVTALTNPWTDTSWSGFGEEKVYVVQTNTEITRRCLLMTTDPGDLVLDPTCGSGTTAYVAEQWGRRWITVDTSRVALALARTRLMAAKFPYYLLADSPEGAKKEAEVSGALTPALSQRERGNAEGDVRKGFVYKRVPHVTLKSIANNEEIDAIHARWQAELEPVRAELNRLLKQSWQEWQIPREVDERWPREARRLHGQWWEMRRERQQEIDASIAKRADTELLYDQPYEDNKRVRVSGPFTVESLSPHRVLATEEERPASEAAPVKEAGPGQYETMVLENLKKAGIQNTKKNERLKLDRLEPFAGTWLQAAGEYTDAGGATRRIAISLGPEHGTVGPEQVKEAAKEALHGVGFDLLIVCGFAFDAHAGETAGEFAPVDPAPKGGAIAEGTRQYGKLAVLLARMNPDLAMGDAVLKKTGSGNLFMVFGEPDIVIKKTDGKVVVEIKGLDIYDPTTGEIRSSSTDDIACWFLDTDYNEEAFFVRHACFTGADEPYEKLKRALRAEIDEAAWSALYSTVSRLFDPPASGKIAVKVINHYGDEVLKVYRV